MLLRIGLSDGLSVSCADVGVRIGRREVAKRILERLVWYRRDIEGGSAHRWLRERANDLMISLVSPGVSTATWDAATAAFSSSSRAIRICPGLAHHVLGTGLDL